MKETKFTHGGRRPGAGRPVKEEKTKQIALRIPSDVVEILNQQPNKTQYIIDAVRTYYQAQKERP